MYRITVENGAKRFGPRKVFADINFDLKTGESLAIVGRNGAGKSTLLLCLLRQYLLTKGTLKYFENEKELENDSLKGRIGFVSPYLNFYTQLSAEENIRFIATVKGVNVTGKEIDSLLSKVGLEGRGADLVAEYSSGMYQRLKYAVAIMDNPPFLFLDEPTSNLDSDGKGIVTQIVEEHRAKSIIVIATNEQEEYSLAEKQCRVGQ